MDSFRQNQHFRVGFLQTCDGMSDMSTGKTQFWTWQIRHSKKNIDRGNHIPQWVPVTSLPYSLLGNMPHSKIGIIIPETSGANRTDKNVQDPAIIMPRLMNILALPQGSMLRPADLQLFCRVTSGKHPKSYWKCPSFVVHLPIFTMVIVHSFRLLPEDQSPCWTPVCKESPQRHRSTAPSTAHSWWPCPSALDPDLSASNTTRPGRIPSGKMVNQWENHRKTHGKMEVYALVNVYSLLLNSWP